VEVLTMTKATCSIDGCEERHEARGWCNMHYRRWRAHGDPLRVRTPESLFWAKVDKFGPDGFHSQTGENLGPCWLWQGAPDSYGYGQMRIDGRLVKAHRFAYELLVGPIPEGLEPDHLCRVHHCVHAPEHLEPVTHAENMRRGFWSAKTACPQGHEYSPDNTFTYRGMRYCRECKRHRDRHYYRQR
jgi:hypothetical protein